MGNNVLRLDLKFEEASPRKASPIAEFARGLFSVLQSDPRLIPHVSFGRAERMANGLVDVEHGMWGETVPPIKQKRLASVEHAGKPLLRYIYDDEGRLIETAFPGDHAERYAYDSEGRAKAVQWDGQMSAAFTYHKHGGLASKRYADGSSFYYEIGAGGLCNSWRYPDGVECFVERDAHGRLSALSCGAVTLHYVWDRGNRLKTIATATPDGVSRLELGRRKLAIPFEEQTATRRNHRALRSAIGLWVLNDRNMPSELISPLASRVCLIGQEQASDVARWTPGGRTIWSFKDGVLDGVTASDGSRTVFVPAGDNTHVFALSARGVDVFRYVDGYLAMTRSVDGSFTRLAYAGNGGPPCRLESPRLTQHLQCNAEGRLFRITSPRFFRATNLDNLSNARTIEVRLLSSEASAYVALDTATSWLINWPGFSQRNRLNDG